MTTLRLTAALCVLFTVACLQAQSTAEPRFEVASVKRNTSGAGTIGQGMRAGQVALRNESLQIILWTAYGGNRGDFVGLPGWATTEPFDIIARGNAVSMDETASMLRVLLRERFALQMHRQERKTTGYTITRVTAGELGPQLRPSSSDCSPQRVCTGRITGGSNVATGATWPYVVERIRFDVGKPIVDNSGLSGHFDFELTWTPGLPTASDTGPDIFEALRDQLGLKLESTTASEEVWIVDHVERPSPD